MGNKKEAELASYFESPGSPHASRCHELRKELGSLVTVEYGIYAASRVLRHSTVATTAAHYTDLKARPTIAVGAWLKPENVVSMPGATRHEPCDAALSAPNKTAAQVGEKAGWLRAMGSSRRSA